MGINQRVNQGSVNSDYMPFMVQHNIDLRGFNKTQHANKSTEGNKNQLKIIDIIQRK